MANTKDKVKGAIDRTAKAAKKGVEKATDKASDAARTVGKKVKETGQKIKDLGS